MDMYSRIMKLDRNASPVEIARVELIDGKAVLPKGWEMLSSIVGVDPKDGKKFIHTLPMKLRGDRLWATVPSSTVAKVTVRSARGGILA